MDQRLNLRIPQATRVEIDRLVAAGEYESVTDFARQAIENALRQAEIERNLKTKVADLLIDDDAIRATLRKVIGEELAKKLSHIVSNNTE
jgi:ribosomal protein S9